MRNFAPASPAPFPFPSIPFSLDADRQTKFVLNFNPFRIKSLFESKSATKFNRK